ncbi:MAG: putative molybdenum carrier protein, partial [Desulfobulbus sp.]|nr:putative molybdenum carrier protein [Desulfobulbus sp.]
MLTAGPARWPEFLVGGPLPVRPSSPSPCTRAMIRIISGGQTGADQAALDAAIALSLPHGGWLPRGRKTESGPL